MRRRRAGQRDGKRLGVVERWDKEWRGRGMERRWRGRGMERRRAGQKHRKKVGVVAG